MLLPVIEKVKALKPDYIRIDRVFDSYEIVSRDSSGNLNFNWSNLDLTLGDILNSGAKPFIAISYMPPAVSRGDIVDLPVNWSDWELCVQKLIEHVSGKNGLNLSHVYYEVWNEPDLFGDFKNYGKKSYSELYLHTVSGANRAQFVNSFKVGGPATTGFYPNWIKTLIKMKKEGVRVDFFSWHRYAKDLDIFEKDYLGARKLLEEAGLEEVELIISESGPNSENDKVYDNFLGSIHLLALNTYLEGKVDKAFVFEIKDGPCNEKYWGRWGLLTHEKFGTSEAKPRYNAVTFLNRMSGRKINVAGSGSWVKAFAREVDGKFRIMAVNYDPEGKHVEAVPLTFINLPFREFSMKRINYNGGEKETLVATNSATWRTVEEFSPNTAAIFELIPLK